MKGKMGLERPRHPTLDPVLAPGKSLSQYKREIGRDHWPRGHSPVIFPSWSFLLKIQVYPFLALTLLCKEFQSHRLENLRIAVNRIPGALTLQQTSKL